MTGSDEDADLLLLPDGRRVQVWRGGASSGPAVFFFHGTPDCRLAAVTGAGAAARAGVQLVAANRPGYGRSDPDESTHLSVADDTAALADLLGIEEFGVLGMSLGGPYALACAARHPSRVRAAVAIAAPASVNELGPPGHRDDLTPEQRDLFAQVARATADDAMDLMRPGFERYVARLDPTDPDDVALVARWIRGLHPLDVDVVAAWPASEHAAAAREALASPEGYLRDVAVTFRRWTFRPEQVGCPTWLEYGALDAQVSERNGRWLAQRIGGAVLEVREDTGHLATLAEHWDELLGRLRDAGSTEAVVRRPDEG